MMKIEKVIQELLRERTASLGLDMASAEELVQINEFEHTRSKTPELYFGYNFTSGRDQLGNSEGFNPNNDVTYKFPENNLRKHYFYLDGT